MRARRCLAPSSQTAAMTRRRPWCTASGSRSSTCWSLPRRTPSRCSRNGRKDDGCRCRAISKLPAKALIPRRASLLRCRSTEWRLNVARAPTSAPQSRPPLLPCWSARECGRRRLMSEAPAMETGTRCGFVALIGAPNSGKSTLTNALVGAKVSIVTHKAQTTRGPVRGIALIGDAQVILVDTPGIFQPKRRLDRAMSQAAWERAEEADIVAVVIDAHRGLDSGLDPLLNHLPEVERPAIAILNKIDLVSKPDLLRLTLEIFALSKFCRVFMVSALTGDGIADLRSYLASAVPAGPWLFPEDQLTDASLRQTAAEITREKLFLR